MLSRTAEEFAAQINSTDWSDAHSRFDRAGHHRDDDRPERRAEQLDAKAAEFVRANVMINTAQVLSYRDPNFSVEEFAEACGVTLFSKRSLIAALRLGSGKQALAPGSRE